MSARDKLLAVLRGDWEEECYCDNPHCTPPEVLVDAYAHELAEEIRREGGHRLCDHGCKDYDANLIDPEVST